MRRSAVEALSIVGAVLGVLLSIVASFVFARRLQWPVELTAGGIGLGVGSAIAVGVAAGLYPALRASRLDPIEALRHE